MSHTPTPWSAGGTFDPYGAFPNVCIWGPTPSGYASGDQVAQRVGVDDGEHIINCVNNHDALVTAAKAALAYDAAIQGCANDPDKMSSHCTADGDDLDTLYAAWISASRAALAKVRP